MSFLPTLTVREITAFLPIPIREGNHRVVTLRATSGLIFSTGGRCTYTQNGASHLSDAEHALYLPEGGTYSIDCAADDVCPLINFRCDNGPTDIVSLPYTELPELLKPFWSFERIWPEATVANRYMGISYLYSLLGQLEKDAEPKHTDLPDTIRKAIHQMRSDYGNPELSNETLAEAVGMSVVGFRKRFTVCCGQPPMRYLTELRMVRACALLQEQALPVQEIAYAVGYSSLYSFSRAFRAHQGCSPSQYRTAR